MIPNKELIQITLGEEGCRAMAEGISRKMRYLLLLMLFWMGGSVHAQNLLLNSGFESDLTSWSWGRVGGATGTCTVDSAIAHWEGKSVLLTYSGTKTGGVYGRLNQTVSGLTVGKQYYAYIWCKGTAVGSNQQLATGSSWQFRVNLPSGTYDWTCVELAFVADATSLPVMLLMQDTTTALRIDDIYLTENRLTDVTTLGIAKDGSTDVASALTTALSTYKFLYFPPGTYLVNSMWTLPDGSIIWGAGSTSILKSTSSSIGAIAKAAGTDTAYVKNVEVSGLHFTGLTSQYGVCFVRTDTALVRNCIADNSGLVLTKASKTTYASVTAESDLCANIRVAYNSGGGTSASPSSASGINFRYVMDSSVYKNTFQYYNHGILWWGGDSNFSVDGGMTNPRWARRLTISTNTVSNMTNGGIWGSMGINISVISNTISTCGDVALDFEGCFDSTAQLNTVTNGANGCLSTFFGASNITFSSNTVKVTNSAYPLFRLYNSSLDSTRVPLVTISSNTFSCTSGVAFIDDASGPGTLVITGNTLTNVGVDITRNGTGFNGAAPTVTSNTFTFNNDVSTAFAAIDLYYYVGNPVVSQNVITYNGATTANKTGISVQKLKSSSPTVTIESNVIKGFEDYDIYVYYAYTGLTAKINSNTVQYGNISAGASGILTVSAAGNKDVSGVVVSVTALP